MLESDLASWKCFLLSLPSLSTAFFSFWKACESEERACEEREVNIIRNYTFIILILIIIDYFMKLYYFILSFLGSLLLLLIINNCMKNKIHIRRK